MLSIRKIRVLMTGRFPVSEFFKTAAIITTATLMCVVFTTSAGCGSDGPSLGRVSGIVTNQSKPVEGLIIEFFPESGDRPSIGTTDADGRYELYFLKDKPGAVVGQHSVRFEMRGAPRTISEEEQYGMPPATAANPGGDAMPKNTSFQPDSVEVMPSRNEFNFERLPNE